MAFSATVCPTHLPQVVSDLSAPTELFFDPKLHDFPMRPGWKEGWVGTGCHTVMVSWCHGLMFDGFQTSNFHQSHQNLPQSKEKLEQSEQKYFREYCQQMLEVEGIRWVW